MNTPSRHRPLTLVALGLAAALSGGAAHADQQSDQQNDQASSQPMKSTSYAAKADKDMAAADTDKDQKMSKDEADAAKPELVGRWAEFDINKDGSIDTTELYLYEAHHHIEQQAMASKQDSKTSAQASTDDTKSGDSQSDSTAKQ